MPPEFLSEPYRPIQFVCQKCEEPWETPLTGCPRCDNGSGYGPAITPATPDPVIWSIGVVPGYPILLSAHLRDQQRFISLTSTLRLRGVVDVAADPEGYYVWRPTPEEFAHQRVRHHLIENVWDNNVGLEPHAFDKVYRVLRLYVALGDNVLLHCSAGLKRAPHLLYGCLLKEGLEPNDAWHRVKEARPFASPYEPYVKSAHEWAGVEF